MRQIWLSLPPFCWAAFFILALYNSNKGELAPSEMLWPLLAAQGLAALAIVAAWVVLRDTLKATIVATFFLILFFTYGHAYGLLQSWGAISITKGVALVWACLGLGCLYIVFRMCRDRLNPFGTTLNIISIVVVLIPASTIMFYEVQRQDYTPLVEAGHSPLTAPDGLPDIYYIILDSYTSSSNMQELWDYDNSEIESYLTGKGFYLATESTSNYCYTTTSLASSLNMEYINYLEDIVGSDSMDESIPRRMVKDSAVMNTLREAGYTSVHFASYSSVASYNQYADINGGTGRDDTSEFSCLLVNMTPIRHLWHIETSVHRQNVLSAFDLLRNSVGDGPRFYFFHITLPHHPYSFSASGGPANGSQSDYLQYLDQVGFANLNIREVVDVLLARDEPPIIIIQGDHGPGMTWEGHHTDQHHRAKFSIFNAIYPALDGLYASISPVNTFRVVLNDLGASYELLEDRSYATEPGTIYQFYDVTEIVR